MTLAIRAIRRLAHALGWDLAHVLPPGADCIDLMVRLRERMRPGHGDDDAFLRFCLKHLANSRSDLLQDLWVLHETGCLRGGVFVEFGAADGVAGSNTCLLETAYGWRGLLVEPASSWHAELAANRRCLIDHRCVADHTGGEAPFRDCAERALSTIEGYQHADRWGAKRAKAARYAVETVSLNDLLDHHGLHRVDYLSVDTEGSELMILTSFDFDRFQPRLITVEHGHEPKRRSALHGLLSRHGYRRRHEALSQIDDWYVRGDDPPKRSRPNN